MWRCLLFNSVRQPCHAFFVFVYKTSLFIFYKYLVKLFIFAYLNSLLFQKLHGDLFYFLIPCFLLHYENQSKQPLYRYTLYNFKKIFFCLTRFLTLYWWRYCFHQQVSEAQMHLLAMVDPKKVVWSFPNFINAFDFDTFTKREETDQIAYVSPYQYNFMVSWLSCYNILIILNQILNRYRLHSMCPMRTEPTGHSNVVEHL